MIKTKIDKVIDDFHNLSLDAKEYVTDILKKILIEAKREAIARRGKEAQINLKSRKVKTGNVEELYKDLEND